MQPINDFLHSLGLAELFHVQDLRVLIRVCILLLIGLPSIILLRRTIKRSISKRYSAHYGMVAGKFIWYIGLILLILVTMHQLSIDMTPILGAAGVLGVAIGFASQTSVSNIISGFFLIAEKSFEIGDVITVGQTTGYVLSIDTLSVKLRTFDNRLVRIPNEMMIKTEVINVSHFPIRRVDLMVGIAYKEDVERVKALLTAVARENPKVLNDPTPLFIFNAFGASSIDLQFSVWALKDHWLDVKNEMYQAIKARFEREEVEIPFPHVSVYKGAISEPIPIEIVQPSSAKPS